MVFPARIYQIPDCHNIRSRIVITSISKFLYIITSRYCELQSLSHNIIFFSFIIDNAVSFSVAWLQEIVALSTSMHSLTYTRLHKSVNN